MNDPYPKWARWIAQDSEFWESAIIVYEYKPNPGDLIWKTNGRYQIIDLGTPNPHWRHSLDYLGEDDETV